MNPHLGSERYMIGKELASAADVDPRTAFDVLRLLLETREGSAMAANDLTRNAVPMVLARAIDSKDAALSAEATQYRTGWANKGTLAWRAR